MINDEIKFETYRGANKFIESVLNSVDNKITNKDLMNLSDLFDSI